MNSILTALGDRRVAMRNGTEKQKGFTLIELLVVVIIIGILAAIAIPVFLNQRQGAWQASVESDVKNAQIAAETYATQHNGSYTGMTTALLTSDAGFKSTTGVTVVAAVTGGGTGYTLTGTHSQLTGKTWVYDTAVGTIVKS